MEVIIIVYYISLHLENNIVLCNGILTLRNLEGCPLFLGINSFKTFMAYKDVMMLTDEEVRGRIFFVC